MVEERGGEDSRVVTTGLDYPKIIYGIIPEVKCIDPC